MKKNPSKAGAPPAPAPGSLEETANKLEEAGRLFGQALVAHMARVAQVRTNITEDKCLAIVKAIVAEVKEFFN